MNFSLPGLLREYQILRQKMPVLVLATLIETEGSTYRKSGARMLVDKNKQTYGLLGGAELHRLVLEQAQQVFHTNQPCLIDIDMQTDGEGPLTLELEPDARLRILLQCLSEQDDFQPLELLRQATMTPGTNILVTVCESDLEDLPQGTSMLITEHEKHSKEQDIEERYIQAIVDIAQQIRVSGKSSLASYLFENGSFTAFYDLINPPLHILIIGAGPDAIPVVRLAGEMGWRVTITDCRQSFIESGHFEGADQCIVTQPQQLFKEIIPEEIDAAVLMTHRIDFDKEYFRQLYDSKISYIGLMGTQKRKEKLLASFDGNDDRIDSRVYGPVGLNIGARTPEEIALAIVAEIQAKTHAPVNQLQNPAEQITDSLHTIVLAAGGSTRFGGIKQLVEYQGKSLLKRSVELAQQISSDRVTVVLGLKAKKLEREITALGATSVINNDWANGVASSLRAGISALPDDCKGVLILLCDQPLITRNHLHKLIDIWRQDPARIAASSYADTLGIPALFPNTYFNDILQLQGDKGAKSIIMKYRGKVATMSLPEAETDIDTQTDMIAILNKE